MRGIVVVGVVAGLAACAGGNAAPCDRSVENNVDRLVALSGNAEAWDEYTADLFDGCPAKATLVTERLMKLAED